VRIRECHRRTGRPCASASSLNPCRCSKRRPPLRLGSAGARLGGDVALRTSGGVFAARSLKEQREIARRIKRRTVARWRERQAEAMQRTLARDQVAVALAHLRRMRVAITSCSAPDAMTPPAALHCNCAMLGSRAKRPTKNKETAMALSRRRFSHPASPRCGGAAVEAGAERACVFAGFTNSSGGTIAVDAKHPPGFRSIPSGWLQSPNRCLT
jgi:hypothetical protein